MTLAEFHGRLATTLILFFLALSIWGFFRFFMKKGLEGNYWGALVIGEIVAILQGGIGFYMWAMGDRPTQPIHILYGAITAIAIPSAFAFTKGGDTRREMVVYAAVTLFLVGIGLRALDTGGL
jgi:hypothetical protein